VKTDIFSLCNCFTGYIFKVEKCEKCPKNITHFWALINYRLYMHRIPSPRNTLFESLHPSYEVHYLRNLFSNSSSVRLNRIHISML